MRVLVAGEGVVGFRIAEALMQRHHVVYIGPESESGLDRLDIELFHGEVTSTDDLRDAGVEHCDVFVGCTNNDERNLVACVTAKGLGAGRTLCMLSRPGFLDLGHSGERLAASLGLDVVIRPAEHLAHEIIRIVTEPGALDVELLADGRVTLLRYAVEAGAPITHGSLSSLELPRNVVLVTVRRGDDLIMPKGTTRVEPGDKIIAMGRRGALIHLAELLRAPGEEREAKNAVIVGAGTVGAAVARGLEDAGWRIKVIEQDPSRCEEVSAHLDSIVFCGDGADLEFLEQEQIGESSVLVAVTNNDEKNLLVSLLGKHLGVPRIVTRADRLANERMFDKVGIDVVRSAHGAAIRSVVVNIDSDASGISAELEHGAACIIELDLPVEFVPLKLRDLQPSAYAIVGAILRNERLIVPTGQDELQPRDQLLVFCAREDEERTRRYFLDPRHDAR